MSLEIAVMGAGCIGAWVGAQLASAGAHVTLVGRPRLRDSIDQGGIFAKTLSGKCARPTRTRLQVVLTPETVETARLVIISVKGPDTVTAAQSIAPHLHKDAVVVSLQNGIENSDRIRAVLPDHAVVSGMVPFNVVWEDRPPQDGVHLCQATSGDVVLGRCVHEAVGQMVGLLRSEGLNVQLHEDMKAVQWAKLVLNLNNAINALSGTSLRDELRDRGYRRVLARAMNEAWAALDAAKIRPAAVGRMRPRLAPWILPLPDVLFHTLAAPMIRIDPAARSSMADDLERGRLTEVDDINGAVVTLAHSVGLSAPLNAHLVTLVHDAEARGAGRPSLPPTALWPPALG